ncbi:MAG TPA: winged helix-turn-helix domain-containing protein [Pyrinomonadaceae bacterium]|nr:winged helix-turn-helix domain-containing protein [Pyrinomonadaceae bacterium]
MKVVKAPAKRDFPHFEFGSFRIHGGERTLLRDGALVPLVPKSFDVLFVLVENSGRLLDKELLLSTVWPDTTVAETSLTRAIADIRRALGEGPRENRFIATVARRGYRFVAQVTSSLTPPDATVEAPVDSLSGVRTLAVLPFDWLTRGEADGSLAVGLADALITRLSNLTQIVVRPTSSILRYSDGIRDPVAIAAELNVDFVVSGGLQQAGDEVRVTVQMVNPKEQRLVWADHFEETLTNIFLLEDSISARIAAALALKLSSAEQESLVRRDTQNNEAYQLYLRGRYFWSKHTHASADKAISYFQQALDLDPDYARAWAGVADAYVLIGLSGALTGGLLAGDLYPKAKRAALAAINLNTRLADAYASLGFIQFFYDWDAARAQDSFNQALTLQPRYAIAHHGQALVAGFSGRYDEALLWIDSALEIEPLSLIFNANKGYLLYISREYDAAVAHLKKTMEIDASFPPTHYRLGLAYQAKGASVEAIRHFKEAHQLTGNGPYALGALGYILACTGNKDAAKEVRRKLDDIAQTRYVASTIRAEIMTGLGEYYEALGWLKRALDERVGALWTFRVDPRFEQLRTEPGCRQLLESLPS